MSSSFASTRDSTITRKEGKTNPAGRNNRATQQASRPTSAPHHQQQHRAANRAAVERKSVIQSAFQFVESFAHYDDSNDDDDEGVCGSWADAEVDVDASEVERQEDEKRAAATTRVQRLLDFTNSSGRNDRSPTSRRRHQERESASGEVHSESPQRASHSPPQRALKEETDTVVGTTEGVRTKRDTSSRREHQEQGEEPQPLPYASRYRKPSSVHPLPHQNKQSALGHQLAKRKSMGADGKAPKLGQQHQRSSQSPATTTRSAVNHQARARTPPASSRSVSISTHRSKTTVTPGPASQMRPPPKQQPSTTTNGSGSTTGSSAAMSHQQQIASDTGAIRPYSRSEVICLLDEENRELRADLHRSMNMLKMAQTKLQMKASDTTVLLRMEEEFHAYSRRQLLQEEASCWALLSASMKATINAERILQDTVAANEELHAQEMTSIGEEWMMMTEETRRRHDEDVLEKEEKCREEVAALEGDVQRLEEQLATLQEELEEALKRPTVVDVSQQSEVCCFSFEPPVPGDYHHHTPKVIIDAEQQRREATRQAAANAVAESKSKGVDAIPAATTCGVSVGPDTSDTIVFPTLGAPHALSTTYAAQNNRQTDVDAMLQRVDEYQRIMDAVPKASVGTQLTNSLLEIPGLLALTEQNSKGTGCVDGDLCIALPTTSVPTCGQWLVPVVFPDDDQVEERYVKTKSPRSPRGRSTGRAASPLPQKAGSLFQHFGEDGLCSHVLLAEQFVSFFLPAMESAYLCAVESLIDMALPRPKPTMLDRSTWCTQPSGRMAPLLLPLGGAAPSHLTAETQTATAKPTITGNMRNTTSSMTSPPRIGTSTRPKGSSQPPAEARSPRVQASTTAAVSSPSSKKKPTQTTSVSPSVGGRTSSVTTRDEECENVRADGHTCVADHTQQENQSPATVDATTFTGEDLDDKLNEDLPDEGDNATSFVAEATSAAASTEKFIDEYLNPSAQLEKTLIELDSERQRCKLLRFELNRSGLHFQEVRKELHATALQLKHMEHLVNTFSTEAATSKNVLAELERQLGVIPEEAEEELSPHKKAGTNKTEEVSGGLSALELMAQGASPTSIIAKNNNKCKDDESHAHTDEDESRDQLQTLSADALIDLLLKERREFADSLKQLSEASVAAFMKKVIPHASRDGDGTVSQLSSSTIFAGGRQPSTAWKNKQQQRSSATNNECTFGAYDSVHYAYGLELRALFSADETLSACIKTLTEIVNIVTRGFSALEKQKAYESHERRGDVISMMSPPHRDRTQQRGGPLTAAPAGSSSATGDPLMDLSYFQVQRLQDTIQDLSRVMHNLKLGTHNRGGTGNDGCPAREGDEVDGSHHPTDALRESTKRRNQHATMTIAKHHHSLSNGSRRHLGGSSPVASPIKRVTKRHTQRKTRAAIANDTLRPLNDDLSSIAAMNATTASTSLSMFAQQEEEEHRQRHDATPMMQQRSSRPFHHDHRQQGHVDDNDYDMFFRGEDVLASDEHLIEAQHNDLMMEHSRGAPRRHKMLAAAPGGKEFMSPN